MTATDDCIDWLAILYIGLRHLADKAEQAEKLDDPGPKKVPLVAIRAEPSLLRHAADVIEAVSILIDDGTIRRSDLFDD